MTPEDPSAFCSSIRSASAATGSIADLDVESPREVEFAIADLNAAADAATAEIADDMVAVAATYEKAIRGLAAVVPSERANVLRDMQGDFDAVSASAQSVQRYAESTCGVTFTGPPQPTPSPTPLDIDD